MRSYQTFQRLALVVFAISIFGSVTNGQKSAKRPQWEYCAITKSFTTWTGPVDKPNLRARSVTSICYFQPNGCRQEDLEFQVSIPDIQGNARDSNALNGAVEKASQGALARAIVKLGEDGWEMIGEANSMYSDPDSRVIYFKRRK